jgi:hypothetical protein
MYALPKLEWMLRRRGFEFHLIGATPDSQFIRERDDKRISRGEEIGAWIATLDGQVDVASDIVIIDDDSDMDDLTPRLFQTSAEIGLRAEHVDEVVKMLDSRPAYRRLCVGTTSWAPSNVQCMACGMWGQRCERTYP